jgi:UDP-glucose 4-epimerase
VNGTQNVLDACLKNNITKIISTSTAAVYQNTSTKTILDETSPVKPLSPYGESKLEMENKIITFCSVHNISYLILRLFNVYGVGQSLEYAGVITKFYEKLQNSFPLIIFGDGTAVRDFVHIDDVTDAIILSISHSSSFTCNIASGTSTSISDLAKTMIALSNKDLKILNKP